VSRSTKEQILASLVELLEKKQLDDITVTELVEHCGISRQAFYYHFSDIFGVVEWAAQEEIAKLENVDMTNWKQVLEDTMARLRESRVVLLNIYRAYERSYVEHSFRQWGKPILGATVRETAKHYVVDEDQIDLVTELCTHALASVVLGWVDRGMPARPIRQIDDFYTIMEGCLDFLLKRLEEKNKNIL
jgi:AcrR family transcriptional regulator